jgi:glycosyltransferase involved in cell wall biosynthesis
MTDNTYRPLHLGYVLRIFPALPQTFILNEISALERLGYKITVFGLNNPGSNAFRQVPEAKGYSVIYLYGQGIITVSKAVVWLIRHHFKGFFNTLLKVIFEGDGHLWKAFHRALLLARAAEKAGVGHLHAHLRFGTEVVWLTHSLTGRSYSFTAHSGNLFMAAKSRYLPAAFAETDFAVTVCGFNQSILAANKPQDTTKIHVIRPFLGPEWYGKRINYPVHLAGTRALRLASVSRLVPKKGIDILISALHGVLGRGIAVHLSIIGDGPERSRLETQIQTLGLEAQVTLLGAKGPAEVKSLLEASDCFVLASRLAPNGDSDATPTVLGEAMAVGLPVISTRIAGIPEIVPDDAGWLVQPGEAGPLTEAIVALAEMTVAQRHALGENGRRHVHVHWNSEQDALRLAGLFTSAVQRRATTSSSSSSSIPPTP